MLSDDRTTAQTEPHESTVTISRPDPARAAVVDVVSLRGLARGISVLRGRDTVTTSFDDALARMINVNGAIAKAIEGGER